VTKSCNRFGVGDTQKFWTWPKCFLRRILTPRILRNWHVFQCGSMRIELGWHSFYSVCTRLEIQLWVTVALITTPLAHFHLDQIRIVTMNCMQYTARVDAVLRCGLKQVDAVRTKSIQILIGNWNPCKKLWTRPKKFFRRIVVRVLSYWHGLRCRSIWVKPGRYSFYTVWTQFEIQLCVAVG
jgi:hypothetical protein